MRIPAIFLFSASIVRGLPQNQVPLGPPPPRQAESPFDKLFDKIATDAIEQYHVPGFSVAVVNGHKTYAKGYGISELPAKNATEDSLYFVGSTTKSFTAASILKLIQDSANSSSPLSLRSRIVDYIPWKLSDEYVTGHATLEDALSHRTGLPRHDLSYGGPNFTIQNLIDSLPYLPVTREIRQEWQYCNIMFLVLSSIIEKLSGSTLGSFFKKHIWDPLGMTNTYINLDDAKSSSHLATGYYYDNDTAEYLSLDYIDPEFVAGAGGIISSVSDFAKYLRAMLQSDPVLLSAKSYTELRTGRIIMPQPLGGISVGPAAYSLGWMVGVISGVEVFYHTGNVPGFTTFMMYIPQKKWAVAVMANGDIGGGPLVYALALELLSKVLEMKKRPDVDVIWANTTRIRRDIMENLRKIAYPDAPPPEKAIKHALPLHAYTGLYHHPGYRTINLTLNPPATYVGVPIPSENGKILHAKMTDRTWPQILDFEHINAEHFLVRWHMDFPRATNFDLETEAGKAQFEIGSDSRVQRVGIGFVPEMWPELIWFDRVE
jgi:CubicO group peptidase (beta-lactamase class C family)